MDAIVDGFQFAAFVHHVWRDAEIQYLQALLEDPSREPTLRKQLEHKRQQLQSDFELVAQLNQGGEFVTQEQLQRLGEIAMIRWQRHFDDRLGLSGARQSVWVGDGG